MCIWFANKSDSEQESLSQFYVPSLDVEGSIPSGVLVPCARGTYEAYLLCRIPASPRVPGTELASEHVHMTTAFFLDDADKNTYHQLGAINCLLCAGHYAKGLTCMISFNI